MDWGIEGRSQDLYAPPWPQVLGEVAELAAERFVERAAFVHNDATTTYAAWAGRVDRLARQLVTAGVQPGDRVSFVLPNSVAFFDVYLAIARAGAVAVPIGTRLSAAEVGFVLDHSGSRCVLHDASTAPVVRDALAVSTTSPTAFDVTADSALGAPDNGDLPVVDPGSDAAIFYTSGSTASPKGVRLTHRNVLSCAAVVGASFRVGPDDVTLALLPLYHTATHFIPLPTLVHGGTVVLREGFSVTGAFDDLERHAVTLFPTVTAIAILMADSHTRAGQGRVYPHLRKIFIGGAAVPDSLMGTWATIAPSGAVVNCYGMTEMSPMIAAMDPSVIANRPESIGIPYPGNEVRIVRADGSVAGVGETGEFEVRGPSQMAGYFRNEQATADVLHDGWLLTGDLGVRDEDGYLRIVGRKKWMLKRGGENVFPDEVESVLIRHPAVTEVMVLGVADKVMGERIAAVVALAADHPLSADALRRWALDHLADFKVPELYHLVAGELPKNGVGKVDAVGLRNAASRGEVTWIDVRQGGE